MDEPFEFGPDLSFEAFRGEFLHGPELDGSFSGNVKDIHIFRLGFEYTFPEAMEIALRSSEEFDQYASAHALTDQHLIVISELSDGGYELASRDFGSAKEPTNVERFRPWLESSLWPESGELEFRFRAPVDGHRNIRFRQSTDLNIWIGLDPSAETLIPDLDGDGATELRSVRVPASAGDYPLFYQLIEE